MAKKKVYSFNQNLVVEEVTARMKSVCTVCENEPAEIRLKRIVGTGRFQTSKIYCRGCGNTYLGELREKLADLQDALVGEI